MRYLVRPKADRDLDEQAFYLATEASPEIGHRFLVAAHETFALLAAQPRMGRHFQLRHVSGLRVFRLKSFNTMLILYRPSSEGVEILRVIHASRNMQALLRREGVD